MHPDWTIRTIEQCASDEPYSTQIGPFGNKIRAKIYTPTGAPVLRGTQVNTEDRYHDDDYVFVSEEYAEEELQKFVCEADDIILCHKGTLGKIGIIPRNGKFERYIMGNSMMRVRCNRDVVEPLYLYYWLSSDAGQNYLFSRVSQVGVPQIQRPLTTLRECEVPLPPIEEQRAIASILGALDDKIELNRRMHATLESLARAIFKSWFVDFDPVKINAGQMPASSAIPTTHDPKVLDLFPSTFQGSRLGPIPQGWSVDPLPEAFDFKEGPGLRNWQYTDEGMKFLNIRCINGGDLDIEKANCIGLEEYEQKYQHFALAADDVVISTSGTLGRSAIVRADHLPVMLNTSIIRMRPIGAINMPYIWQYLKSNYFLEEMMALAAGSVQLNFGPTHLKRMVVLKPSDEVLNEFSMRVEPLIRHALANRVESSRLAANRDALLPQLLSGSLPLDEFVEEDQ